MNTGVSRLDTPLRPSIYHLVKALTRIPVNTLRATGRSGRARKLTLIHDRLEGAPKTAANVSGEGWMFVLSGLKTVLEAGKSLTE
jgi:hypothetical protein